MGQLVEVGTLMGKASHQLKLIDNLRQMSRASTEAQQSEMPNNTCSASEALQSEMPNKTCSASGAQQSEIRVRHCNLRCRTKRVPRQGHSNLRCRSKAQSPPDVFQIQLPFGNPLVFFVQQSEMPIQSTITA